MSLPATVTMTQKQYGGARTIDEVIEQMDDIIAWAKAEQSRLGYFAALYRKVTVQVKEGIQNGMFEDGARMEVLDVTFANRYLTALNSFLQGKPASKSWMVAFESAESHKPIIMQHLLLGMNAHINLDLGIAAAQTCPGNRIGSLEGDFMKINTILSSLVDDVREEIDQLSPWIDLLDNISPTTSDAIVNFSMEKARDFAWHFAQELAPLSASDQEVEIRKKDHLIADLGYLVAHPIGMFFRLGLWVIRLRESSDVVRNIDVLSQGHVVAVPQEASVLTP